MGLYQKIRPEAFSGVKGQDVIVRNIQAASRRGLLPQVILFAGHHGCGKTTLARVVAMAANCRNLDADGNPCLKCASCRAILNESTTDYKMVDGASNNGVDYARLLKDEASYMPVMLKKKVFVIDEVHMLSTGAFNALLKLLEDVPRHCMFILCTTNPEAIPDTILSRVRRYSLGRIATPIIRDHLIEVARKEGFPITRDACMLIAEHADGAMRDALQLLEQVSLHEGDITTEVVADMLGATESEAMASFIHHMLDNDQAKVLADIQDYAMAGKDFATLSGEMLTFIGNVRYRLYGVEAQATEEYNALLSSFTGYSTALVDTLGLEAFALKNEMRKDSSETNFQFSVLSMLAKLHGAGSASAEPHGQARECKKEQEAAITAPKPEPPKSTPAVAKPEPPVQAPAPEPDYDDFADLFGGVSYVPSEPEEGFRHFEGENPFETYAENAAAETPMPEVPAVPDADSFDLPDVGEEFPPFLRHLAGLTLKQAETAQALRELCAQEKSFCTNLQFGFNAERTPSGWRLTTKDALAYSNVLIFLGVKDIPGVSAELII